MVAPITVPRALFLLLVFVVSAAGTLAFLALIGVSAGATFAASLESSRADPVDVGVAQVIGAAIAIAVGLWSRAELPLRDALGVRPLSAQVWALCLVAGLCLAFPLREVALLLADVWPNLAPEPSDAVPLARALLIRSWQDAVIVPLAFVVVPAVSEELFFRGLLLPGLAHRIDPRAALGVSALLFGVIHGGPIPIVYATLAGLALGWLRLKTGSVLAPIAAHGAVNAVPVLLPATLIRVRGFNTIEPEVYHLPLTLVLGSLIMTLVCLAAAAHYAGRTEPRG